ncbi:hypothetical protein BH23CHL2_BH23CHL2_03590 [soil metagenome]
MNELIERGLRSAASALASALNDRPDIRPQQFTREGEAVRDRRRSRQSEEQLERESTPEEERRPRRVAAAQPAPGQRTMSATALRHQLRNRNNIRRAILISEVLDRPRALRPYRQNST